LALANTPIRRLAFPAAGERAIATLECKPL
jgi:hypothetical protein